MAICYIAVVCARSRRKFQFSSAIHRIRASERCIALHFREKALERPVGHTGGSGRVLRKIEEIKRCLQFLALNGFNPVRPVPRNGFGMAHQGKYGRINPIALCRYIAQQLWRMLRLGIQCEVPLYVRQRMCYIARTKLSQAYSRIPGPWGKCSIEREEIDGAKPKWRPEWNARV